LTAVFDLAMLPNVRMNRHIPTPGAVNVSVQVRVSLLVLLLSAHGGAVT